jgi:signal transduction histidine kinase
MVLPGCARRPPAVQEGASGGPFGGPVNPADGKKSPDARRPAASNVHSEPDESGSGRPDRRTTLREEVDRLRAIFETTSIYQGVLDPEGMLLEANGASLAGIQAKLEDVVGRPFSQAPWFTDTPGMPALVEDAVRAAASGSDVQRSIVVELPTGRRSFDMSLRPVRDGRGDVVGIVHAAVETTERRKADELIHQSQKMEALGQLTDRIAHDFNNLLHAIVGWLGVMQLRVQLGRLDQLESCIEAAQGAAQRAATLTNRLLAFSRRSMRSRPTSRACSPGRSISCTAPWARRWRSTSSRRGGRGPSWSTRISSRASC